MVAAAADGPDRPNLVIMVGFSGHGFKMAPVFGEIAADLVATGATGYRIAHLAPTRIRELASVKRGLGRLGR